MSPLRARDDCRPPRCSLAEGLVIVRHIYASESRLQTEKLPNMASLYRTWRHPAPGGSLARSVHAVQKPPPCLFSITHPSSHSLRIRPPPPHAWSAHGQAVPHDLLAATKGAVHAPVRVRTFSLWLAVRQGRASARLFGRIRPAADPRLVPWGPHPISISTLSTLGVVGDAGTGVKQGGKWWFCRP